MRVADAASEQLVNETVLAASLPVGRALGAPREAVLAAVLYGALSALVAAAVKLLRLGQNASHTLLAEALAAGEAEVSAAPGRAMEQLGTFNPWWDIASARHETADFRLFIS